MALDHTTASAPTAPYYMPEAAQYVPQGTEPSFNQEGAPPQATAVPVLTKAMHNQTLELLARADEISSQFLGKSSAPSSFRSQVYSPSRSSPVMSTPITIDLSDRSIRMFNGGTTTHVHNHGPNGQGEKDDSGTRILVGIIGLVVTTVATFFVGKAMAENEENQDKTAKYKNLKTAWYCYNHQFYDDDTYTRVNLIIPKIDKLLKKDEMNRIHKLALLGLSILGGVAAVGGALSQSYPAMKVAAAIGVFVLTMSVFKLGYDSFSTIDKKVAKEIETDLTVLKTRQFYPL